MYRNFLKFSKSCSSNLASTFLLASKMAWLTGFSKTRPLSVSTTRKVRRSRGTACLCINPFCSTRSRIPVMEELSKERRSASCLGVWPSSSHKQLNMAYCPGVIPNGASSALNSCCTVCWALIGVSYRLEDIKACLEEVGLLGYLPQIDANELARLICG
jgi:hypothetical protein